MICKLFEAIGCAAAEKKAQEDNFSNGAAVNYTETGRVIGRVVGMVLSIAIVLLIGKYLWNNAACKLIDGLKPVKNVLHLLGLMLLIGILFP